MAFRNDGQPWYKERWPWLLMAGPAIVIVAGVVTAWLAVASNDGLVTDDYYKQGLAVNQQLGRDKRALDLGLQASVMRAGANVRLLINAETNEPLPEAIVLKLAHPTRAGHDQLVELRAEGQGFYSGKLSTELTGRWLALIEDPAGKWRLQGDWLVDSEEPLRLTARAEK